MEEGRREAGMVVVGREVGWEAAREGGRSR